jgi:hypothetical protein
MPNLQSITNKLKSQFSTPCPEPDFTPADEQYHTYDFWFYFYGSNIIKKPVS